MKISTTNYSKSKQAILPLYISDYLDICNPVLVFDRFMEGIDLEKYLKNVPKHITGRIRYNPANMLKAILFGFMSNGYISPRELEDNCKVNLRYMYLMEHQTPSYRTFGYFIENILSTSVEELFCDINKKIFAEEHVDLSHLYIDDSKFEANANKYSWVWKIARISKEICMDVRKKYINAKIVPIVLMLHNAKGRTRIEPFASTKN